MGRHHGRLVLAAALLNVAGLWLNRLLGQSHEQAIQVALGAGRWRTLARPLLEFVLLGEGGTLLALVPLVLRWLESLGMLYSDQALPVAPGGATVAIAAFILAFDADLFVRIYRSDETEARDNCSTAETCYGFDAA